MRRHLYSNKKRLIAYPRISHPLKLRPPLVAISTRASVILSALNNPYPVVSEGTSTVMGVISTTDTTSKLSLQDQITRLPNNSEEVLVGIRPSIKIYRLQTNQKVRAQNVYI